MGRIVLPVYTPYYIPNGNEVAVIETSRGTIRVQLAGKDAPVTAGNFIELAARGFYDKLKFHAHKPGSVVLGGCPTTRTLGPAQVDAAARGMIRGIHPGTGVGNHRHSLTRESLGVPVLAIGVPTVVGAAAIVHDTVSALIRVLADNDKTKGTGSWIEDMDSDQQYQLIRELLEPEFGPLYVTPPDIDQSVKQLSFTISEGIHQAVFP